MQMIGRRGLLLGATALSAAGFLAACNQTGGGGAAASADDISLGDANAPVKLIEYASTTCPHCAEFHHEVWEQLKTNYIDTGKVHFTLREFPAPAALASIAVAEFQVARCGGASPEQYYNRVGAMMAQQRQILSTGSYDGIREALVQLGAASNLSREQVMACIDDEAGAARIQRNVDGSAAFGVTGTPTLILNGTKLDDPSTLTYEGLSRAIDAAIAGT